jgi:hypothetical protein
MTLMRSPTCPHGWDPFHSPAVHSRLPDFHPVHRVVPSNGAVYCQPQAAATRSRCCELGDDAPAVEPDDFAADEPVAELPYVDHPKADTWAARAPS